MSRRIALRFSRVLLLSFLPACGNDEMLQGPARSREELLDPEACRECHQTHYEEWAGSMHAYASRDPVFLAMNALGQEQTKGKLGDFCVNCHAPMALRDGLTRDGGTNLPDIESKYQGVTCYFCHNVESVGGTHNNPLTLANDQIMRGGIRDATPNPAHYSAYSPLLDRERDESARACGACHDLVTPSPPAPAEVELERTFKEWEKTFFAATGSTCGSCHMERLLDQPIANFPGVGNRPYRHMHTFPGVDVALTDFPDKERQREAIQTFLATTLLVRICVSNLFGDSFIAILIDNVGAGHNFPSGAAQDRRAWNELVAYDADGNKLLSSGVVPDGGDVTKLVGTDPDLWLLRDRMLGPTGDEVHQFWEAADVIRETMTGGVIFDPKDPSNPDYSKSHQTVRYPRDFTQFIKTASVERVTLRVRIQPMGFDVLDELAGVLDSTIRAEMPVFDLLPNRGVASAPYDGDKLTLEWTREIWSKPGFGHSTTVYDLPADCVASAKSQQK